MHISEQSTKLNSIQQEIQARRTQNIENQTLQHFQSYRPSRTIQREKSGKEDKGNSFQQQIKLRREELYKSALTENQENGDNKLKYRYDIHKDISQDKVKEHFVQMKQPQSYEKQFSTIRNSTQNKKENVQNSRQPFSISNSSQKNQIKSIIFDSKISKFQPYQATQLECKQTWTLNYDQDLDVFKRKVGKVNNQIEASIDNLALMIRKLKQKKIEQSMLKSKALPQKENKIVERKVLNPKITESMVTPQENIETKIQISKPFKPMEVKAIIKIQQTPPPLSQAPPLSALPLSALPLQQSPPPLQQAPLQAAPQQITSIANSNIQLSGDKPMKVVFFPPEYTSFINRLSNQIQIDSQFTNMLISISKQKQLQTIRNLIIEQIAKFKGDIHVNESFFRIQSQQIDPLYQGKHILIKKYSEEELKQEAFRIYKKYKDCQNHFQAKLKRQFTKEIVGMLFEDLVKFNFTKQSMEDTQNVTVGHLLSYLNMRTSRTFRNRFFIKMLKRLGLKYNTPISRKIMNIFCKTN